MTMVNKGYIEGNLVDVTPTHYITFDGKGFMTWGKEYFRVANEVEPHTAAATEAGRLAAGLRLQMVNME